MRRAVARYPCPCSSGLQTTASLRWLPGCFSRSRITVSETGLNRLAHRLRWLLLPLAAMLLTGCSTLVLVYNRAPLLTYWWIDSFIDVDKAQAPMVRNAIKEWFTWHRAQEVPHYVAFIASLRAEIEAPTSAARICAINDALRSDFRTAMTQALPSLSDIGASLSARQRAHLARRFRESNEKLRKQYLDGTPDAQRERAVERAADAAREIYGRLSDTQIRIIGAGIKASPYDPSVWLAEREARQRDTLAALQRIADTSPPERAAAAARAFAQLAASLTSSPREPYRAYLASLTSHSCELIAQVHASTSQAQRLRAARRLQAWENDLRKIAQGSDS